MLDDISLHRFIGGQPESLDALRARFERQVVGRSPDGREGWLNWTARERASWRAIGKMQATIRRQEGRTVADVAWVVGVSDQGQGFAKEAAEAMVSWLRERGISCVRAHIHPRHRASMAVAEAVGLRPTDIVEDGERRWESSCG